MPIGMFSRWASTRPEPAITSFSRSGLLRRVQHRLRDRAGASRLTITAAHAHDDPQEGQQRQHDFREHGNASSVRSTMNSVCRWTVFRPQCLAQAAAPAARSSIFDDHAVVHVGDAVAELEDAVVVGHDDHGAVGPDGRLAEQLHDGESRSRGRAPRSARRRPGAWDRAPGPARWPRAASGRPRAGRAGCSVFLPMPMSREDLAGPPDRRVLAPAGDHQRESPRSRPPSGPAGGCTAGTRSRYVWRGTASWSRSLIAVMSLPKMCTSPSSASRMPAITERSVVLPQPEGPDDQRHLARVDVPDRRRASAWTRWSPDPKCLVSPRIRTATPVGTGSVVARPALDHVRHLESP